MTTIAIVMILVVLAALGILILEVAKMLQEVKARNRQLDIQEALRRAHDGLPEPDPELQHIAEIYRQYPITEHREGER